MSRESDLSKNLKVATNEDETAPKEKHVRACIVHTWDHKTSEPFWALLRSAPILSHPVQTYKALITVHRVLREGHPETLAQAVSHVNWLVGIAAHTDSKGPGALGYAKLMSPFVSLLCTKIAFHKSHPGFNGSFDYEDYMSLKVTNNPNTGYETIDDLMALQGQIDGFQKQIFQYLSPTNSQCYVSTFIPLLRESDGIYQFVTAMLRAMFAATSDKASLDVLKNRYNAQHGALVVFYDRARSLGYVTSGYTVPTLSDDPPDLFDPAAAPQVQNKAPPPPPPKPASPMPQLTVENRSHPRAASAEPEPDSIPDFWSSTNNHRDAQRRLQEQAEAERRAGEERQRLQNEEFLRQSQAMAEEQKRQIEQHLANQKRVEEDQMRAFQAQQTENALRNAFAKIKELDDHVFHLNVRSENDQLMLGVYDKKVKELETTSTQKDLYCEQLVRSKDDEMAELRTKAEEAVAHWKTKFENLAKLYSQLRKEHIDIREKHAALRAQLKDLQIKANSATEAISKLERAESDVKLKTRELANVIRERDRARLDYDREKGANRDEVARLQRTLRAAHDDAENAERSKTSELTAMLDKYTRQIDRLEDALRDKSRHLDDLQQTSAREIEDLRNDLSVAQNKGEALLDSYDIAFRNKVKPELDSLQQEFDDREQIYKRREDDNFDAILEALIVRIDEALYQLASPMQAGNTNASIPYVASQIEKTIQSADDFTAEFFHFIDDPNIIMLVIKTISGFSGSVENLLPDVKGLLRLASGNEGASVKSDELVEAAHASAQSTISFFRSLQSFNLGGPAGDNSNQTKKDILIDGNAIVQEALRTLSQLVDTFTPRDQTTTRITDQTANVDMLVDNEMSKTVKAIEDAAMRLHLLQKKPRNSSFSTYEVAIHDSILQAAIALTDAIAKLIKAATASQQEIVREGGTSPAAYYLKHNRWTQGLISAAKAVAASTNLLIETADGIVSGDAADSSSYSLGHLVVASKGVFAATAQLVAASPVKARSIMSLTQETLELASRDVTRAGRALVEQVEGIMEQQRKSSAEHVNYGKMTDHELIIRERAQQLRIYQLNQSLSQASTELGDIRKLRYKDEED